MTNETTKNAISSDLIEANLTTSEPKSVPALEPFERMYPSGSEQLSVVPLVPPANPIMLDGIEKKRPLRSLLAILMDRMSKLSSTPH